jgi:ABC-2 type transport system ATP-binding protein
MDEVGERFTEVMVEPQFMAAAKALQPLSQRTVFGKAVMLFDGVHRQQLSILANCARRAWPICSSPP